MLSSYFKEEFFVILTLQKIYSDLILRNKNLSELYKTSLILKMCDNCYSINDLKTCSGCKRNNYCSLKCQIEDWKFHKSYCHTKMETYHKSIILFPDSWDIEKFLIRELEYCSFNKLSSFNYLEPLVITGGLSEIKDPIKNQQLNLKLSEIVYKFIYKKMLKLSSDKNLTIPEYIQYVSGLKRECSLCKMGYDLRVEYPNHRIVCGWCSRGERGWYKEDTALIFYLSGHIKDTLTKIEMSYAMWAITDIMYKMYTKTEGGSAHYRGYYPVWRDPRKKHIYHQSIYNPPQVPDIKWISYDKKLNLKRRV